MKPREFLQVDPASLHLPGSRREGADPVLLAAFAAAPFAANTFAIFTGFWAPSEGRRVQYVSAMKAVPSMTGVLPWCGRMIITVSQVAEGSF